MIRGQGGLDAASAVGPFLGGTLPPTTPRSSTGDFRIVDAFPNLAFNEPLMMIPVPGDNRLIVVEKDGRLVTFENDALSYEKTIALDIRTRVESQDDSGMLGVAFHPQFGVPGSPNRDHLYVFYRFTPDRSAKDRAYLRLSRFTWAPATGTVVPESESVLINQYDRNNWHSGGGLLFGPDGFLYLTLGDEGGVNDAYDSAQSLDRGFFGGAIRIDVDQDPSRSHPIRRQPRNDEEPPPGWPPTYSQGYFIPNDNPWLAEDGSRLEEFYAIGLRSPHRLTLDPATGDLWVGDVGQSAEEEILQLVRGGNYQWPFREGFTEGAKPRPANLVGTEMPPVHSYGRSEGTCVIGGYVYRGTRHPELLGKYLFGDLGSEQVWTAEMINGQAQVRNLLDLSTEPYLPDLNFSSFGIDAAGEIYMLFLGGRGYEDGRIYRIDKRTDTVPEPPALLSQTGAFSNLGTLAPAPGVIPYDVIQPLWSDAAEKKRWIAIPNDGTPDTPAEQITWSAEGNWSFPIGTVLIKHFEYPGRRLETRFMVHGEDRAWFGFTYRWRPDGSDAELLPSPALEETMQIGGETRTWHFPGRGECASCHNESAGRVLGVNTRQLNHDFFYETTGRTANQLATLNRLGFFAGGIDESALPSLLTARNQADESASLERRARSYLDVNCAHCHQPGTPARAVFDARLTTAPWSQNLITAVPFNDFGIPDARLVTPGSPEASTVYHRANSVEPGIAMPPVAKHLVDTAGMQLLRDWIGSLDPEIGPTGIVEGPSSTISAPPRITFSRAGGTNPQDGSFEISVTADKSIQGLRIEDFLVANGNLSNLGGSGRFWTVRFTPRKLAPSSLVLPADRVTDDHGNANERAAFDFVVEPGPELLENGGIESGLSSWDTGPRVAPTDQARTGVGAASLGRATFLSQTVAVRELADYRYTGQIRSISPGLPVELGISFYDTNGVWIEDETLLLSPGSDWAPFVIEFTARVATREISVWVRTGESGQVLVDDLSLRLGGLGQERPAFRDGLTNRLNNGGFEAGLDGWQLGGGEVVAEGPAPIGDLAARLGTGAFIVQSQPATPGQAISLQGIVRRSLPGGILKAGFSFWDVDGALITDRSLILAETPGDSQFLVDTVVPEESASLTVWIWRAEGAALSIDHLHLFDPRETAVVNPNLLVNGDFNTGTLTGWETAGGATGLVPRSGAHAAALGSGAFLIQSLGVVPGGSYRFSGQSRKTVNSSAPRLAGVSSWSENGESLGDTTVVLDEASDFAGFSMTITIPAGARTSSVWVWSGMGGGLETDDLEWVRLDPAPVTEPVRDAAELGQAITRTALTLRSNRSLDFSPGTGLRSDPAAARSLGTGLVVYARGWRAGSGLVSTVAGGNPPPLLATSMTGPGTLMLQWQLRNEAATDSLSLHVDGSLRATWRASTRPAMIAVPVTGEGLHAVELRLRTGNGSSATATLAHLQMLPVSVSGQADLGIGGRTGAIRGIGTIDRLGTRQTLRINRLPRSGGTTRLSLRNASRNASDAADFSLGGNSRGTRFDLWENGPARKNVSALLKSGRYQTAVAKPGATQSFQVRILRTRNRGPVRMLQTLRARSVLSPAAADAVRVEVQSW